jgi:hypothetical protein
MQNLTVTKINTTTISSYLNKKSNTYLVIELLKYIGFNMLSLTSILFIFFTTYMMHWFYNKIWKPYRTYVIILKL